MVHVCSWGVEAFFLGTNGFRQELLQESFYPGRTVFDVDICKVVFIWDERLSLIFFFWISWTFSLAFGFFRLFGFFYICWNLFKLCAFGAMTSECGERGSRVFFGIASSYIHLSMTRSQARTGPLAGWDVKILNTSQCDHGITLYNYSKHKHKRMFLSLCP